MIAVPMQVSASNVTMRVRVSTTGAVISVTAESGNFEPYSGQTTFTPTASQQTIHTAGHSLAQDIVINPIPNNYGLITYNGSVITVS